MYFDTRAASMGSVSREMTGKEGRRPPKFPGLGVSDDWDAFPYREERRAQLRGRGKKGLNSLVGLLVNMNYCSTVAAFAAEGCQCNLKLPMGSHAPVSSKMDTNVRWKRGRSIWPVCCFRATVCRHTTVGRQEARLIPGSSGTVAADTAP